jgi:hypothetical protein
MRTSLLKTLACKYDSTGQKMAAKYRAKIETPHGLRTCLQVVIERSGKKPLVTRFGGIPLKRQPKAVITDRIPERVLQCYIGLIGAKVTGPHGEPRRVGERPLGRLAFSGQLN